MPRASTAYLALPHRRKASDNGAFEVLPSAFILAKAGDSFIDRRIHTEMASSSTDTRKGMRQPQASNAAGSIAVRTPRITSSDRNRPRVAVVWIQAVKLP